MNTHSKFFIHDSDRVARGLPLHLQLGSRTTLSSSDYCTAQSTDYSATDYSATNYILFRACEACLGLCCSWSPKDVELLGKRQVGWRTRLARCMGRFLRHRKGSSSMRCASIDVMSKLLLPTPRSRTDPQLSHAPLKTRAPTALLQNVR